MHGLCYNYSFPCRTALAAHQCTVNEKIGREETRGQVLRSSVINRRLPGRVRRRIRFIEGNAKSLRLKSYLENDFAASAFLSPPLLVIGLREVKQFYSLLNLVLHIECVYGLQHNPPPPRPTNTQNIQYTYCILCQMQGMCSTGKMPLSTFWSKLQ
jgi:hypothetical protein